MECIPGYNINWFLKKKLLRKSPDSSELSARCKAARLYWAKHDTNTDLRDIACRLMVLKPELFVG